jgi:hypothetical protein
VLVAHAAARAAPAGEPGAAVRAAAKEKLAVEALLFHDCELQARRLELALALEPGSEGTRHLADRLLMTSPPPSRRVAALAAMALAEHVRLAPATRLQGSVAFVASTTQVAELKLAPDDPLLTEAAVLLATPAAVVSGQALDVVRKGTGATFFAVGVEGLSPTSRPVPPGCTIKRLVRTETSEHGVRWLRSRWVDSGPLAPSDLLLLETAKRPGRTVLEQRLLAAWAARRGLLEQKGVAVEPRGSRVRIYLDESAGAGTVSFLAWPGLPGVVTQPGLCARAVVSGE